MATLPFKKNIAESVYTISNLFHEADAFNPGRNTIRFLNLSSLQIFMRTVRDL